MAINFEDDLIVNPLGDLDSSGLGSFLAARVTVRWSVILFFAVEMILLAIYRDCLTINVLMFVHPLESVKSWQMGPDTPFGRRGGSGSPVSIHEA